ncbi:type VI secretion system Vgr family protein [Massilia phyllosphaerae]|uniref:type VI secretion system Vgr family protein n=1 Tax=Massilia phyllosphaerae TaxID=3106034 RepID=UPI002B1CD168|nr:type VI secretion system Vgr family protein [Massilia sp. SGZ-792]
MSTALRERIVTALVAFASSSRLYALTVGDDDDDGTLLVEAFAADDAIDAIGTRDVIVLSTSAHLDADTWLGQPAALDISLADGTRTRFAGDISEVDMLGSDGGLARYRIRIASWLWRLAHVRSSRVWQERSVVEIVDSVFEAYQPQARWRWSDDVATCMEGVPPRSYCCQYRESDLDFVRRLLAGEGLCWRIEQGEYGPGIVLFADSTRYAAVPEDATSAADDGIRYHGARSVERQDTVQALAARRSLHVSLTTLLSSDYKAKQIVAASSPSLVRPGRNLPVLESFDTPRPYAFATREQAQRHADMRMEAQEARGQLWQGRSTVRTLRAGTRMTVTGTPLRSLGDAPSFTVLRATSLGVNNLPTVAEQALAQLFGPLENLLQSLVSADRPDDLTQALAQARETGYANCFDALPADIVWRPIPDDQPTAFGSQSAIVVGADGNDQPNGADELYCDRLGRVRIRFHWQDDDSSCWVRVAQRVAGGGMGTQFLPRIGQEVLVQFLENDIDRPIIVGALYNGRGEGGIAATPGGRFDADSNAAVFAPAHDQARSGQGNLTGGNSPVWHGTSAENSGHRNSAAQWGVRSKEFGGSGYNQLLFDDTDGQGRVQLRCTHGASSLDLGHLIHAADNYRGSFRGKGAELRTDAYGAVRAGKGLLVSSYSISHNALTHDPAAENASGVSLLDQASELIRTLHGTAQVHQTVGLAAHIGAAKLNASVVDDQAAPLKAIAASMRGILDTKVLYANAPIIMTTAIDSLGVNAGQSLQLVNNETALLASGQDTQFATCGRLRVHTGQAIGVLAGAIRTSEQGIGLQMIVAKDVIDIQAQADEIKVQARDEVDVTSANAHIDWAAATRIKLSTAGGANITIENGSITVQCPGKITVYAGKKSFTAPVKLGYPLPSIPTSICVECLMKARDAGSPFVIRSA